LGVDKEVQDGLFQGRRIKLTGERLGGKGLADGYVVAMGLRLVEINYVTDYFVQVARDQLQSRTVEVTEKTLEDLLQPVGLCANDGDLSARSAEPLFAAGGAIRISGVKLLGNQVKVDLDRTKRIFYLVGKFAGELAEVFKT
jgi:hypothetical protein